MREIQLKDAKATLPAVVDGALKGEVYAITRRAREEAVIASWAEWERLSSVLNLGKLLAMAPLEDNDLAPNPFEDLPTLQGFALIRSRARGNHCP